MIIQIMQHTPGWVWVLLLALIYIGYLQSRTRIVAKARLFALPAAMLGLSLYSLFATFGAVHLGLLAWLAGGTACPAAAARPRTARGSKLCAGHAPL